MGRLGGGRDGAGGGTQTFRFIEGELGNWNLVTDAAEGVGMHPWFTVKTAV